MKQVVTFLALLAIYFVSTSAHSTRVIAPRQGYIAPTLELQQSGEAINTSDYQGKYLLLSFWSSTDAPSRVRCNQYESLVSQRADIVSLNVNLDRSENLFREVVKFDNLDMDGQIHIDQQTAAKVIEQFGLEKGLKTFLIDPAGCIVAINPTLQQIPV